VFSWKRRTVASSSDCNFLGGVTTKAEAESTSATKRDNDKAREVQRMRTESRAEEKGFLAHRGLLLFWVRELSLWWWWRERVARLGRGVGERDLERKETNFLLGERENGEEKVGEEWKCVERTAE
jgi:hypothetical protein